MNELPEHIIVTKEQCNQGGAGMAELYKKFYFERKIMYPNPPVPDTTALVAAKDLVEKGYTVVENAVDKSKIDALKNELSSLIGQSKHLGQNNNYFIQINQQIN